ncbi:MAG: hypothetical protein ACK417_08295 [Bacteroidia bacterium]
MNPALPEKCTICQTPLQGSYCHGCGQKHGGKEAGVWLLLQESLATFFSLEKSGLATIWALLSKPRNVVMNYIQGNRGYWQSPNKLIFYALIIYGLHVIWKNNEVLNMSFDLEGINPSWFFLALVLPFLVVSSWLLYVVKKTKMAHHLISVSYFWALWFILITLLGDALDGLFEREFPMIDFAVFLLLVSWYEARVFASHYNWWKQALLALTQVLLFFILLALLVGVIYLAGGRVSHSTL